MSFSNPYALILLLLLPVLVIIGWPRLAHRRRDSASLIVRLVLATLVILGLAGMQVERVADKLAVVFLIDASDSVPPDVQKSTLDYVRAAADEMTAQDQAAVVVFGADALVEIPMTGQLELVQMGSDPIRLNTDLAEAMRVGLALFPADTAKRMVILSDGAQTVGDAEEVARLAVATGVRIDYVALTGSGGGSRTNEPEVMITDVDVPVMVNEGEQFNLTVTLTSTRADNPVEVRILSGGRVIHRREVTLQRGATNTVFEIVAPATGFADFQVIVEPRNNDRFYQNNQLAAFTEVTGPPRVLLVTLDAQEVESLRTALQETGLQVDVRGPRELPLGLVPLSSYDSIVLANISAVDLSQERMAYLQAYVRDLGGGLVVIGGPNSFGVGGYFLTPLEEMLPVEMRIRDQERIPTLTILFVLDRSGSMGLSSWGGVTNLELAKEAVARSFALLNDSDRTGVLSFDVGAYSVIEVQALGNAAHRQELRQQVGTLRPGGGTNIRQGVLAAEAMLQDDPSQLKHIILLTDGGSNPTGIVEVVEQMFQDQGITLSVVAIGSDYARWLHDVAQAGQGQFHLAQDVSTIPAIFAAETVLATRSYIFEEDFFPTFTARHPITAGIESMPLLKGYVAATGKDTATVLLRGPEDDPLLAAWQYGLGRSVAFMSDASSRWAAEWIGWDGYADFWSQAVRWTIIEGSTSNVETRVVERGEQAILVAEVRDNRGDYLNGLQLDARISGADLEVTRLTLQQTAPGRYEAVFMPSEKGAYFVTVAGYTPVDADVLAPQNIVQTIGWVLSYSAEYRVDATDSGQDAPLNLLKWVADTTGGTALGRSPQRAFSHNLNQEQASQPVWRDLLLVALLLLPLDVALRRVVITREDLEKARAAITARLARRQPELSTELSSARLDRLVGAKQRARDLNQPETPPDSVELPLPTPRDPVAPRSRPKPHRSVSSPVRPPEQLQGEDVPQSGTLASRLLDRRRTARDQDDEDA